MKISDHCTIDSSSATKGFRKDATQRDKIKQRQAKRRDIEDINQFMATLAAICPQYYSAGED